MQIIFSLEKYGIKLNLHDFSQGMFVQYQKATIQASKDAYVAFNTSGVGVTATAEVRGESVKAAINIGILSGIDVKDVDELKSYVVNWIADELSKHVKTVTTEPADPNLSSA